ncbi:MAG TPA: late competence development ComFB family protein [Tissierellia bacterium]|nr:late competence development ComFB family protein [Tissierellia bacterium]
MPTNLRKEPEEAKEKILGVKAEKENIEESSFINRELNLIKDEKEEVILCNITEKILLKKFDGVLKKMSCCRCDRCKQDIVALALNNLKPKYIVANRDEIEKKVDSLKDVGSEVTRELIKAVVTVRKNPRH